VQLGCQAGGQCACFQNNAVQGNAFNENGSCADNAALVQQFLDNCLCP
jgi:hypothetical protein